MNSFRFLNWKIYTDAKKLFKLILEITKNLPSNTKYSISDQLIRSAFSIILNIAEGSGKNSDKELNRYFDIAMGSCYELLASLDTLKDNGLIAEDKFKISFEKIENITKQLGGFKKSLK